MKDQLITLKYDRIIDCRETRRAFFFVFGDQTVCLPKSQVEDIRETAKEVDIPLWLAEAKGLEGYAD
jgi:hypothetical protein